MLPFLLLATRAEDDAAADEYAAMRRFTGLTSEDLRRRRLEHEPLGEVDLDDWSGIILGGGPYTVSDPEDSKPTEQRRAEADIARLLDQVVARDFPFLGTCYGIGTLGRHEGALVDRRYGEPIGRVPVSLTQAGRADALFGVLPETFEAFVGHKEAVTRLPGHAVLLAGSPTCPVQAFRVGRRVYATQFHPELDGEGLAMRISAYRGFGYFDPAECDVLQRLARERDVEHPPMVLRRFVEQFAR